MSLTTIVILVTLGISIIYVLVSLITRWVFTLLKLAKYRKAVKSVANTKIVAKDVFNSKSLRLGGIILSPLAVPLIDAILFDLLLRNTDKMNEHASEAFVILIFCIGWVLSSSIVFLLSKRFKDVQYKANSVLSFILISLTLIPPAFMLFVFMPSPNGSEGAGGVAEGLPILGLLIILIFACCIMFIASTLVSLWRISQFLIKIKEEKSIAIHNAG